MQTQACRSSVSSELKTKSPLITEDCVRWHACTYRVRALHSYHHWLQVLLPISLCNDIFPVGGRSKLQNLLRESADDQFRSAGQVQAYYFNASQHNIYLSNGRSFRGEAGQMRAGDYSAITLDDAGIVYAASMEGQFYAIAQNGSNWGTPSTNLLVWTLTCKLPGHNWRQIKSCFIPICFILEPRRYW